MKQVIKRYLYLILFVMFHHIVLAQNGIGIGTSTPDSSAKLDVTSTAQGILIPRMSTAQRNSIGSPAMGLMVYDIDKRTIYLFDGLDWNPLLFTTIPGKLPLLPMLASDGLAGDALGHSVCIHGNYALVGAPNNDVGGNSNQGSAYVFYKNGSVWTQQATLTASDGEAHDQFGAAVALGTNGDYAIVGSPYATVNGNNDMGCAYIFIRNDTTWTQQAKLTASDGVALDLFGKSVTMEGDYVVIGGGIGAYVYYKNADWYNNQPHQAKLTGSPGNAIGADVCLSGDYVVVGAPLEYYSGLTLGAAYVFHRSGTTWTQEGKMYGQSNYSYFGYSVSMDGDYVAVGSWAMNSGKGMAYTYYRNTGWTNNHPVQSQLTAVDGVTGDSFGWDVSLSGDYVLISAPDHDYTPNGNQGASYLFKRTGTNWNYMWKTDDESKLSGEKFGLSLSIHNYNTVHGIPGKYSFKGEVQFGNIE